MIKPLDTAIPPYTIAFRHNVALSSTDFQRHIAAVSTQLKQETARTIVLYCDDAYWFAVGLFSAWLAHKIVALPGDSLVAAQISGCALAQTQIEQMADFELATASLAATAEFNLAELQHAQLIVYTSGSSGQAKAIAKAWPQLLNEVAALESQFGAQLDGAVVLGTVSHQHIYGLLFRVLWPLVQGRAFSTQVAFFPESLLQQSQLHAKVIWVSSPAHYKRLSADYDWQGIAPHLAALFSSGGILPLNVAQTVQGYSGLLIQEIFGSSETGGVAHRQSIDAAHVAWTALPKVQIQISLAGALQIKSPHLPADQTDWYTMDDAARWHSDGGFELLGRLDRIVKIEEKRISLVAIEQALLSLPEVKDAAVFAEHENGREYIAAVLVLQPHQNAALQRMGKFRFCEQLKRQLTTQLTSLALPRRWRFVAEIPLNTQGKVSQAALKALFSPPVRLLPQILDLQPEGNCATYQLKIGADIAYFAGHFQNMPVLPGVTQIHWAVQFARQQWLLPEPFLRLEAIKFQQVILPEMTVKLDLNWDPVKLRLTFAFTSPSGAHSSGRIVFGVAL